jgi:hypothetical protein
MSEVRKEEPLPLSERKQPWKSLRLSQPEMMDRTIISSAISPPFARFFYRLVPAKRGLTGHADWVSTAASARGHVI